jgi:hypothetical protein
VGSVRAAAGPNVIPVQGLIEAEVCLPLSTPVINR